MDREALELRVAELLRETGKMSDTDKKNYITKFIAREIEKDITPMFLDRHDLTNIESNAVGNWRDIPGRKKVDGQPLTPGNVRTLMFLRAVVSCLRKCGALHRIVDVEFDTE